MGNRSHTKAENIEKELTNLQQQVTSAYQQYNKDPFIIPAQFRYLFLTKDANECMRMGRDSLRCCLRSVGEAKPHQENFVASLAKIKNHLYNFKMSPPST
jgi:hypothetical protein